MAKMNVCAALALAVVTASACASEPEPAPLPMFADCPAATAYYTARVGRVLGQPIPFEPHRVLPPNAMITMDHNPGRLNVYVTNDRVITDARCG